MTELAEGSRKSKSAHHSPIQDYRVLLQGIYTLVFRTTKDMQLAFLLVGVFNIVTVTCALLLNLHVFEDQNEQHALCVAEFGDQALLLAALTSLALATPWNFATDEAKASRKYTLNSHLEFVVGVAVPLSLLLIYATIIVLSLNGTDFINDGRCPNVHGRLGIYTCLVWISLFAFLHTTLVSFSLRYARSWRLG